MKRFSVAHLALCVAAVCSAEAAIAQHPKMDSALSEFVDAMRARRGAAEPRAADQASSPLRAKIQERAVQDATGRVLVDIYLDGSVGLPQFLLQLQSVGAEVTGVNPDFRFGTVSAYVPVSALTSISGTSGLQIMKLTLRPQRNVGATTSQGAQVIRSVQVNTSGYTGAGITVGVLSDSYDRSPTAFTTIRAATDIASGDLKTPKFVIDLPAFSSNTDEGRAMMQIVQDVAPDADQCFATAFAGEAAFAANIRRLRTDPACNADVIVDDVFYYDEPFFSDGQIAQAVNDVTSSTVLAGKPVAYFSSAGNQGVGQGGGAINVPKATFSTTPTGLGNINLATTATCTSAPSSGSTKADVGGGWLDFGGGAYVLPVTFNPGGSTMIMQWDDPFYQGKVSSDLNWYLFNSAGNCVFAIASNNFSDDNGYEVIDLSGGSATSYRIMVARTSVGSHQASRLRLLNLGGWGGTPFQAVTGPATFGHSAAAGAISVAAYRYTSPATQQTPFIPAFERFSSPGPVTIALDAAGNRLAFPETRKKPDLAAPDGGDTTFFYPGSDFEGNGRPNFFGTSAAAPHAAGVAALMLQKAGGPGKLTPKQIKSVLQTTAPARSLPFSGGAPVKGWSVFDGFGLIDAVSALGKLP